MGAFLSFTEKIMSANSYNTMNLHDLIVRAIITGVVFAVLIPTLLGVGGWLWNRKVRPAKWAKGKPTAQFSNIVQRFMRFVFKEDSRSLIKNPSNPTVAKLAQVKNIYIFTLILGIVGTILTGSIWFYIPFIIGLLAAAGKAQKVFKQRFITLSRMNEVATAAFGYGRNSELDPWANVEIKSWTNLTIPGQTIIRFPTKFRADMPGSRDSFERHFTGTITDSNIWTYDWKPAEGTVTINPVALLPEMVNYPGAEQLPWNVFAVGEGADGPVTYDVMQDPHALLAGPTGSGKSVLQQNIVNHCIQHNDRWRFLGVDLKRVELTPYNKYKRTVIGVGTDPESGLQIVKYAYDQMQERYQTMQEEGVTNFLKMQDPPYALLLMIDEAFMFLSLGGSKTDEGKANDQMAGESGDLLGKILRLGRASGVFVLMATQRPDATVIKGEMKNNMDIRIAAGRMDSTPSSMVLDSGAATLLPPIKGRGVIRIRGVETQFQGYWAEKDWIDDWLIEHPDVEPSTIEEGGHLHERYLEHLAAKTREAEAPEEASQQESKKSGKLSLGKMPTKKSASPAEPKKKKETAEGGKISFKDRFSFKAPVEAEEPAQIDMSKVPVEEIIEQPAMDYPSPVNQEDDSSAIDFIETPVEPVQIQQEPAPEDTMESSLIDWDLEEDPVIETATSAEPVLPKQPVPASPVVESIVDMSEFWSDEYKAELAAQQQTKASDNIEPEVTAEPVQAALPVKRPSFPPAANTSETKPSSPFKATAPAKSPFTPKRPQRPSGF